jgi:REP element-mobilizing transposase RayT
MKQAPYLLATSKSRTIVLTAIANVCEFRGWFLYALHVRTNHVHGVVGATVPPSQILQQWKAYASRLLRTTHDEPIDRIFWAHGGSARQISETDLASALEYVLRGQGEPMETYCALGQPRT